MMQFDKDTLNTFRESLERCQTNPRFINRFYNNFVVANKSVREKFANTNMENQKMMLHASLYMIALATQGNNAAAVYLDHIAKRHSDTELNIPMNMYDLWLETLIKTVEEVDEFYDQQIENAWRQIMQFGIDYMQGKIK